jgi:hypothetical protein
MGLGRSTPCPTNDVNRLVAVQVLVPFIELSERYQCCTRHSTASKLHPLANVDQMRLAVFHPLA